ncbi:hypothetical protein, partial [Acinetobacter indicus]
TAQPIGPHITELSLIVGILPFGSIQSKRPLNPIPIFNSIQVSSSAAAILQFGSLCVSVAFSAHHLKLRALMNGNFTSMLWKK